MLHAEAMTDDGYLALDQLLPAQRPLSDRDDECCSSSLPAQAAVLKQWIAEFVGAKRLVRDRRPTEANKSLAADQPRPSGGALSWDVLATMTPRRLYALA